MGQGQSLGGAGPEFGREGARAWVGQEGEVLLQPSGRLAWHPGNESLDSACERGGLEAGCGWAGGTWRGFVSECGLRDSLDVSFYFLPICH